MKRNVLAVLRQCAACLVLMFVLNAASRGDEDGERNRYASAADLRQDRVKLDETVWALEVQAGEHENAIVELWDKLRNSDDQISVLSAFPLNSIMLGPPAETASLDLGIRRIRFGMPNRTLDSAAWRSLLREFSERGFELLESEWHHSSFSITEGNATSVVDFVLHVVQHTRPTKHDDDPRLSIRGKLKIHWKQGPTSTTLADVAVDSLEILTRASGPVFQKAFTYTRRERDVASAHPIILYDLDRNGYPEIIISRWNRVYWNQGKGQFRESQLLMSPMPLAEAGLVADVTGDGIADFVSIDKQGNLVVFAGDQVGKFRSTPHVASKVKFPNALAITAGDVDRDDDLDLWVAQYKPAYVEGQMPTPFYDANDGEPAYCLSNDGMGNFEDVTSQVGLAAKRRRRTYSSSFVDFDGDRDLDLVVVSDYAGIDIYRNDGSGNFKDETNAIVGERHLFGMAHATGDFNVDGLLDIYAIGMSSTTARRLDAMNLGRTDRTDIQAMRAAMGFGNRMYVWDGSRFISPPFASSVARTGWSWGATAFDYDLDGDEDIYVANGFRSGNSCRDYCSTFWRHDIYTGTSLPDPAVASIFTDSMRQLNTGQVSWNGYEHNALLQNQAGADFANVAFLLGVAFEFDSRSVIGNDLDGDGLPDLIVTEYQFVGQGFVTKVHVYRNALETGNHWIGVRVNESRAMGATARLEAGGRVQVRHFVTGDSFLSQHDHVFHFGLGDIAEVDSLAVTWADGHVTVLNRPRVDQYHNLHN